jgi:lysyl-tRNA synthetase class 2
MLKKVRSFFLKNKILEVDPPILTKHPTLDENIDSIKTHPKNNEIGYLHTSPEYMMKRLIAKGLKNIYFLGHVFRKNEIGKNHNLEFTMIEWYKANTTFNIFIKQNVKLIKLFVNFSKVKKITYFDLFSKNFNLNIYKSTKKDLINACKKYKIYFSNEKDIKKDDYLNLLLDFFFEKKAKKDHLYIVYDFPKSQAALAKVEKKHNILVAKRFEFFLNGLEIANGYFELNDENILRKRLENITKNNKNLSIDEKFLKSTNHLGSCFGIAFGFDRLMMLRHKIKNINKVLYFSYAEI